MIKAVVVASALALVLAGCGTGGTGEPDDMEAIPDAAPTADAPVDADGDAQGESADQGSSVALPASACDLFDGIDVEALISTAAGEFVGSDDECSVAAADPLEFAQASITIGAAPAMMVIRSNYEGAAYQCEVADVTDLGDSAFSCLGGPGSGHVVFAAGEYLVIFSAGNTTAGPPSDAVLLDAAQQIYATMAG